MTGPEAEAWSHRHGSKRFVWPPEVDARIIAGRIAGETYTVIGAALGLTHYSVSNRWSKLRQSMPVSERPRVVAAPLDQDSRREAPLPAGHPTSWDLINRGLSIEGVQFERGKWW